MRWPLIALLTCVGAVNYGDRMAISAVYPLLRADLGVSDAWLGVLGSAFLWSYAAGSPVAGWIADRVSRPGVILVSLVAWSAVTLATGFVRGANELLGDAAAAGPDRVRVLAGRGRSAGGPSCARSARPGDRVPHGGPGRRDGRGRHRGGIPGRAIRVEEHLHPPRGPRDGPGPRRLPDPEESASAVAPRRGRGRAVGGDRPGGGQGGRIAASWGSRATGCSCRRAWSSRSASGCS